MGIKALKLGSQERYVSRHDPCYRKDGKHLKGATVFLLGTIDSIQQSMLRDEMTSFTEGRGVLINGSDNNVLAARMAIQGWENLDVKYEVVEEVIRGQEYFVLSKKAASQIPLDVLEEIGEHVKGENTHTEEEAKNFDSASSQSNSSETSETAEPAPPTASDDGAAKPSGRSRTKAK